MMVIPSVIQNGQLYLCPLRSIQVHFCPFRSMKELTTTYSSGYRSPEGHAKPELIHLQHTNYITRLLFLALVKLLVAFPSKEEVLASGEVLPIPTFTNVSNLSQLSSSSLLASSVGAAAFLL